MIGVVVPRGLDAGERFSGGLVDRDRAADGPRDLRRDAGVARPSGPIATEVESDDERTGLCKSSDGSMGLTAGPHHLAARETKCGRSYLLVKLLERGRVRCPALRNRFFVDDASRERVSEPSELLRIVVVPGEPREPTIELLLDVAIRVVVRPTLDTSP